MQSEPEFSQEQSDAMKKLCQLVAMGMAETMCQHLCLSPQEMQNYKKHLELRPSNLGPDAGLGVFATRDIAVGETVTSLAVSHVFACHMEQGPDADSTRLMGFEVTETGAHMNEIRLMQHMFDVVPASMAEESRDSEFRRLFHRIETELKLKVKFVGVDQPGMVSGMPHLMGSFINDGTHGMDKPDIELPIKHRSELGNCNVYWYVTNSGVLEFKAFAPIKAGSELLTCYGHKYWDNLNKTTRKDKTNSSTE